MSNLEFYVLPMSLRSGHKEMLKAYEMFSKIGFGNSDPLEIRMNAIKSNPISDFEVQESFRSYFYDCASFCKEKNQHVPDLDDENVYENWLNCSGLGRQDLSNEQLYFLSEICRRSTIKLLISENHHKYN